MVNGYTCAFIKNKTVVGLWTVVRKDGRTSWTFWFIRENCP